MCEEAMALAQRRFVAYTARVSCRQLKGKVTAMQVNAIRQEVRACLYHRPSLLVLDDVDALCPAEIEVRRKGNELRCRARGKEWTVKSKLGGKPRTLLV